ncbi:MAG: CoA transferase subunit A [Moorellales bacterium]
MDCTVQGKLVGLSEAVGYIQDGMHVGLSGFAVTRAAVALVHELIRQGKKNLTVSQCLASLDLDLLVGAGCVKKLIYGGGSLDRLGPVYHVNRALEEGRLEAEEFSTLTVTLRHLAGALGIPFIPSKSLLGSDLLTRLLEKPEPPVRVADCPFTSEKLVLLRALEPDVALIHANAVDEEGNVLVYGPSWNLREMAMASKAVIVTTEEIVPRVFTERYPEHTLIPGFQVKYVVHQPYGAYPTAVYQAYDYDLEHLHHYLEAARRGGEAWRNYLDRYVYDCRDHWEFLERFGGLRRLSQLRADPVLGY